MNPAPLVIGWPEIGWFVLANAVIVWICAPRLLLDIRRWIAPTPRRDKAGPGGDTSGASGNNSRLNG